MTRSQVELSGIVVQIPRGTNEPLSHQYDRVREHSVALCEPLVPDDYGVQPVADVSPPKWHLAHTSWFFETFLLKPQLPDYAPFHDAYEFLFNSYYNGVGAQHPRTERGNLSRPSVDEVYAYRAHVDAAMHDLLARDANDQMQRSVVLGLHHEQQHQELLLTDIKYILGQAPMQAPYHVDDSTPVVSESGLLAGTTAFALLPFDGGLCEIGSTPPSADTQTPFCFDNETPRHKQWLEPFQLANRLVTNAEYLAFVRDGGYERSELWLSEGWAELQAGQFGAPAAPLYWSARTARGDAQGSGLSENVEWFEYLLSGIAPLRGEHAVSHVSYYEADAYARWSGHRLPSEAEWEVAARSDASLLQMQDSLWQWTQSAYLPYPGFKPLPGTLGEYNGKFMSGQMVLRGGSIATPAGHTRPTYRNFFYPPDRWQFTGIRLAADAD